MGKRETRKKEIIEHAFSVWSREHFAHTTMESLAQAVGMTKPALYRYFSGKEALLEEMRAYFARLYDGLCMQVLDSVRSSTFESDTLQGRFEAYNEIIIRFFAEHGEYFAYAMMMYVPRSKAESEEMYHLEERHREMFPDAVFAETPHWSVGDNQVLRGFLITVGGYLLSLRGGSCGGPWNPSPQELLRLNKTIVLRGLGNGDLLERIDFGAVEEKCVVEEADLLEPDHIFSAISGVVAESGLWEASLEKIARKAGMTKSSLYFYFENRNDMLWKMIDRERHHVGGLFLERTEGFTRFEEKLYAYFLFFGNYMARRPDFMAVMNWFRFQRINLQIPNNAKAGMERYVSFLLEGAEQNKLFPLGLDAMTITRFIHFIILSEINREYWGEFSEGKMRDRFRVLYELFLYGAEGA